MTGQEEKLNCDGVVTETTANSTRSSGTGMTLQSCPERMAFVPLLQPALDAGCPGGKGLILGRGQYSRRG